MPNLKPNSYLRYLLIIGLNLTAGVALAQPGRAQADTSIAIDSIKTGNPSKKSGGIDAPIEYNATDSIIFDIQKNKVYLFRDAKIHYGAIDLTAHYIEVDLNRKEIFATGGPDSNGRYSNLPILKDGDENYTADSMRYNSGSKKGRVYGLRLVQDDAYIHLNKVLKQDDGSFIGQNGKITTCSEDHPHFYFNATKIKVMPNNKALFGPANLVVEDIPTPLAVPFGLAPLKKGRQNGILFPGYGYNQANKSFYLQNLGYYTGLGENMDLAISTDAYLNGDVRLGVITNFVKRYKYRGNVGIDASYFANGEEKTSPQFSRNLDFRVRGDFAFDSKFIPGTVLNGNVNVQTGNFNRLNSRNLASIAQNQFNSGINYGRNFLKGKINTSASVRHSQNTADRSFRMELPSVSIGVPGISPFSKVRNLQLIQQLRVSYNLNFNNVLNTRDTLLFSPRGRDEFKKMQNGMSHSIPLSTNFKMFKGVLNLSPSLTYNEQWYFKSLIRQQDTGNKVIDRDSSGFWRMSKWAFNTGLSTNIYGTYKNLKTGKLRAIRHTITPTLSVGYNPKIDPIANGWTSTYLDTSGRDTFLRYNRFEKGIFSSFNQTESGYIGFGINNNVQAKKANGRDSLGKEKLEKLNLIDAFSVSGSYNLLADSFNFSDIALRMNTVLLKIFNINMDAGYSLYAYNEKMVRINEFSWNYNKKPLHFQNFRTTINTRLNPETFKKKKTADPRNKSEDEAELEDVNKHKDDYFDFNIPWNLSLNYQFEYANNRLTPEDRLAANRISFSGDVNITPEWKIGFSSGYDLKRKELASSQFTVSRNLHCWQIDFQWIPSGFYKQWVFTLRPKSGLLQDLKLNKRAFSNPAFF